MTSMQPTTPNPRSSENAEKPTIFFVVESHRSVFYSWSAKIAKNCKDLQRNCEKLH